MTLHKLNLNCHNLFNFVYHKKYIELKGKINYNINDSIWLIAKTKESTSEGFLTVYKVKYDAVNDITFIDFKKDRTIKRKKSLLQKIKDFLKGY